MRRLPGRVLFWTDYFLPDLGGVEVLSAALLESLSQRGYKVCVVSGFKDRSEQYERHDIGDIAVHRFPFLHALCSKDAGIIQSVVAKTRRLTDDFAPDIFHTPLIGPALFFFLRAQRGTRTPLLVSLQQADDWMQQGTDKTLASRAISAATRVTFCSHWMQEASFQLFPELAGKGSVVPNAINPPALLPRAIDENPFHIVCAGRLSPEKGFDVAVRAFVSIRQQFPATTMTVAGDGDARPHLEELCRRLDVDRSIRFLGWVSPQEIPALINSASTVLVPSRIEAFGLVALQAALMSRPVVGTHVGGLPEVVSDGSTGILVPPDDVEATASAVIHLLEQPGTAAAMGTAGRRYAKSRFVWQQHVDAYDSLYAQLGAVH